MPSNCADDGARQQRALDLAVLLDQGRDPPLAVAGEVDLGRVDDAGRVGVVAGRLRAEGGLGDEAFDRGRERADRGLVQRLRLRLSPPGLCCPTSTSRPASAPASWRSRGRLRRRAPGCGRARRRRTGSGSRPCRRPARPARRPVRRDRRRLSAPRAGSCLRGWGSRSSAAPGGFRRCRRAAVESVESEPPPQPATQRGGGEQAGEGQGEAGRRASAPCYSDRSQTGTPRRPIGRQIGCAAASNRRRRDGGASGTGDRSVERHRPGDRADPRRRGLRADRLRPPAREARGGRGRASAPTASRSRPSPPT